MISLIMGNLKISLMTIPLMTKELKKELYDLNTGNNSI
jgi:hypothetical protein